MATLQELIAEKERIEREIRDRQSAERESALAQIRSLMAAHGLSVADLGGPPVRRAGRGQPTGKGAKVAPKYRHPDTGETWSGRGLKPRWLVAELDQGRPIEAFAIA